MLSISQNKNEKLTKNALTVLSVTILCLICLGSSAQAQFNSGSTGADGALDLSTCTTSVCTVQIRDEPNHVFNYTTINIPSGKTLKFLPNATNSAAILLASGNVTINGIIDISGALGNSSTIGGNRTGGIGGPGGYNGGGGGFSVAPYFNGNAGAGPGGGSGGGSPNTSSATVGGSGGFVTNAGGQSYGTKTLVPLIGGSGGGGGGGRTDGRGCGGGGGGGAVLVASSTVITFTNAQIIARGGDGNCGVFNNGGAGSGGAIRLVANSMSGNVSMDVRGSTNQTGSAGRVRIETSNASGLSPSVSPSNSPDIFSLATPNPVFPAAIPKLRITSIGGQAINNPSNSPHGNPDITIPQTLPNPVTINVAGENIPVGTFVRLIVTPQYGSSISTTKGAPLSGTTASSTASDYMNIPSGLSLITAVCEFDITTPFAGYQPIYINGERVQKIEVSANVNGQSEVTYITKSGKRVKAEK